MHYTKIIRYVSYYLFINRHICTAGADPLCDAYIFRTRTCFLPGSNRGIPVCSLWETCDTCIDGLNTRCIVQLKSPPLPPSPPPLPPPPPPPNPSPPPPHQVRHHITPVFLHQQRITKHHFVCTCRFRRDSVSMLPRMGTSQRERRTKSSPPLY